MENSTTPYSQIPNQNVDLEGNVPGVQQLHKKKSSNFFSCANNFWFYFFLCTMIFAFIFVIAIAMNGLFSFIFRPPGCVFVNFPKSGRLETKLTNILDGTVSVSQNSTVVGNIRNRRFVFLQRITDILSAGGLESLSIKKDIFSFFTTYRTYQCATKSEVYKFERTSFSSSFGIYKQGIPIAVMTPNAAFVNSQYDILDTTLRTPLAKITIPNSVISGTRNLIVDIYPISATKGITGDMYVSLLGILLNR
eukprot:gene5258-8868_t